VVVDLLVRKSPAAEHAESVGWEGREHSEGTGGVAGEVQGQFPGHAWDIQG